MGLKVIERWMTPDEIVFKHEDDNILLLGCVVKVNPGQVALLYRNRRFVHLFGEGTHVLDGELPFFSGISKGLYGGKRVTDCSVYFVNTSYTLQNIKWGKGNISARDEVHNINVRTGANGCYRLRVIEPVCVVEKMAAMAPRLTTEDVKNLHGDYILAPISQSIYNLITKEGISLLSSSYQETEIAAAIKLFANQEFQRMDQGVSITQLTLNLHPDEKTVAHIDRIERERLEATVRGATEEEIRKMQGITLKDEMDHEARMKEIEITKEYLLRTDPSLAENDLARNANAMYLYGLLRNGGYGSWHQ